MLIGEIPVQQRGDLRPGGRFGGGNPSLCGAGGGDIALLRRPGDDLLRREGVGVVQRRPHGVEPFVGAQEEEQQIPVQPGHMHGIRHTHEECFLSYCFGNK